MNQWKLDWIKCNSFATNNAYCLLKCLFMIEPDVNYSSPLHVAITRWSKTTNDTEKNIFFLGICYTISDFRDNKTVEGNIPFLSKGKWEIKVWLRHMSLEFSCRLILYREHYSSIQLLFKLCPFGERLIILNRNEEIWLDEALYANLILLHTLLKYLELIMEQIMRRARIYIPRP